MVNTKVTAVTVAALAAVAACEPIGYPVVETSLGKLRGVTESYEGTVLHAYRGIRYTNAPVNERRFLRSELYNESWTGILNATGYGPVCIQNPAADPNMQPGPEAPPPNEDCLYINVFTPVGPSEESDITNSAEIALDNESEDKELLPVMVWIHGGGLCIGSSSEAWSTGWDFVKNKNVLLVNFNYRLGALGYIVSDEASRGGLPEDKFVGNGGMNGIYDQIVALQWIQREIANFGGDPNRVTVFGDSAGGYSICTLAVAPPAAGLFKRSIIHSGPCVGGWGPLNVSFGHHITQQILANHSAHSLKDLQSPDIDPATIQWPDYLMNDLTIAPYFSAYFFDEGGVVPKYPVELYRDISKGDNDTEAKLNSEDFIIGHTSRDGTALYYGTIPLLPNNASLERIFHNGLKFNWGDKAERVGAQYPIEEYNNSPQEALVAADADAYVICPSRAIAKMVSSAKKDNNPVPTHVFEFAHFKSRHCDPAQAYDMVAVNSSHPGWASHGSDVQYIHGTTFGPNWNSTRVDCPYEPSERHLVDVMQARWRNFATNGSVDSSLSELEWLQYLNDGVEGNTSILRFSTPDELGGTKILTNDRESNCEFWAKELPLF